MKNTLTIQFLLSPLTIMLFALLTACGGFKYEDKDIKEYYLQIKDDNDDVQVAFRKLIDEFNRRAKIIALHYVNLDGDANCTVTLTSGLQDRDGKVGWGQVIRETKQKTIFETSINKRPIRERVYTMRLEFDKQYYYNRMKFETEEKETQLLKLFSHEVGHGLEMGHDVNNRRSIMYPDIAGEKDFNPFFDRVRSYFN